VQGMNALQLVLQYLASYIHLHLFLDQIGNSMGNYTSAIWAKIQDIKECVENIIFLVRWIFAHGEIALLYAEDLSVYVWRKHQFCPKAHRKLDDISELDCYAWFSQNHKNMHHILLHLRVPDT
jgi:hypothetical protein